MGGLHTRRKMLSAPFRMLKEFTDGQWMASTTVIDRDCTANFAFLDFRPYMAVASLRYDPVIFRPEAECFSVAPLGYEAVVYSKC